ncbi:hypothetical protein J3R83DRAFT_5572 [Lanmaoa asiatica]|nr:hypothetical protein J3R83DRAFT_5572 [Lanmaoa asiatica]
MSTLCQDHLTRYQLKLVQDFVPQVQQGPTGVPRDSAQKPTEKTHPKIQFWNKNEWTAWISRPQNYTARKTSFLEGENGEQLDIKTVGLIRDNMRLAWNDLAAQKRAPFTWGRATASVHDYFHLYMEDKWPILKLCNNRWKLDELASITYPGYKRSYLDDKGHLKVKVKSEEVAENTPDDVIGKLDHPGDGNSDDEKNKTNKSKSNDNSLTGQKRRPLKEPKPGVHSKRTKVSFAADETMVPEVTDMEIRGSKPSTEDSDTTWQIVDANKNAPTLSKQDSCTVGDLADDSTSTWDFNPNPVDPTTIENGGINTIPMNGVGRDDMATTTVNSNDNLDVIISSSKVLPSTGPSAGINIVSTVLSETSKEKLTGTVVTDENKKVSSTVKSDQDHSRTEETWKEPLTGGANQAGGSDENPGGDQEPLQKERPKPTQKKSVRLLLKNPISVASLAAAKVDMPELPAPAIELPTPATSEPRPVKLDKDQEAKKQKTKARMRVPSEQTGRNLCARRWLKQVNKDGTKSDFEEYWWTLTKEQHASYDTEAESISPGKEWSKPAHASGKLY